MIPLEKNKLLFRLENIGDHLDSKETPLSVDIYSIAQQLYDQANAQNELQQYVNINIEEVTLSANQKFKDMQAEKRQWKTKDDSKDQKSIEQL